MDAHDVHTVGGIFLGISQHLTQGVGGGHIHIEVEGRSAGGSIVEEQRLHHTLHKLHALFLHGLTVKVLGVNTEVGSHTAVEILIGQLQHRQRAEAKATRCLAVEGVDAVAQHFTAATTVGGSAHPVAVEQMGGGRRPIGTEGVAQIVLLGGHHSGHPLCHLHSLSIGCGMVVAELGAGLQIAAQLLVAFKVALQRFDEVFCILGALTEQAVHGGKGVCHHGKTVDEAAGAVVLGALALRVTAIDAAFQTAHEAAEEGHTQIRQRTGCAVACLCHFRCVELQIIIEALTQILQQRFRSFAALRADLLAGNGADAAGEGQLQDLCQVQPGIGGVGAVLAHDQRLLAACHGVVGQVLLLDAMLLQGEEQRIVVKQRGGQTAGGKEEPTQRLHQRLGGATVQLHRQNRLGQIHFIVGIQNGIGHGAGQVIAPGVLAAEQNVLRDGPAAAAHIEEHQEMLAQRSSLLTGQLAHIRLEDLIRTAHREGKGVGCLLDAHGLPQQDVALHGLVKVAGAVGRHTLQGVGDQLQAGLVLGGGILQLLQCQCTVAAGKDQHTLQRLAEGGGVFIFRLGIQLGDEAAHTVTQGGAEIRHQMAGDLLHEEGHLAGVFGASGVGLVQLTHIVAVGSLLPHGGDAAGGDLLGGRGKIVDLQGVAIALEALHGEGRIDQGIAGSKGIPLGTCKNGMLAQLQGQLFRNGFQLAGSLVLKGKGLAMACLPGDLPGEEPTVEHLLFAALLLKQRPCLFVSLLCGVNIKDMHKMTSVLSSNHVDAGLFQGLHKLDIGLVADVCPLGHGVFQPQSFVFVLAVFVVAQYLHGNIALLQKQGKVVCHIVVEAADEGDAHRHMAMAQRLQIGKHIAVACPDDRLVGSHIGVLHIHNDVVHQLRQLRQAGMHAVCLDAGVDIFLPQRRQKCLHRLELLGHFTAGEGHTAAGKEHGLGAHRLRHQLFYGVDLTRPLRLPLRVGAPGTAQAAAAEMVHQAIARSVLGIIKALLKHKQLHLFHLLLSL